MSIITDKILELIKKEVDISYDRIIDMSELARKYKVSKKEMHYKYILKFGQSIMKSNQVNKMNFLDKLIDQDDEVKSQSSYLYAYQLGYRSDAGLQSFIKKHKGMTFREYFEFRKQLKINDK